MPTPLLIGLIFLAAGFTQGLTGFGSALVALPLLSLLIDIKAAVPLCMLVGLIITGYLSWQLRASLSRRKIMPLFVACLPGIYVGVTFLKRADTDLIKTLLGLLIIGFTLYKLLARPKPRRIGQGWALLAGFLTGAIGAAFSAGGPPTIIYTALTDWDKDEIKATMSGFFFASGLLTALVHGAGGITTVEVLHYSVVAAPFVAVGVFAGSRFYDRVDRQRYLTIVLGVLLAMGLMLVASAFR